MNSSFSTQSTSESNSRDTQPSSSDNNLEENPDVYPPSSSLCSIKKGENSGRAEIRSQSPGRTRGIERRDARSEGSGLRSVDHQGVSRSGDRHLPFIDPSRSGQYDLHEPLREDRTQRTKTSLSSFVASIAAAFRAVPQSDSSSSPEPLPDQSHQDYSNRSSAQLINISNNSSSQSQPRSVPSRDARLGVAEPATNARFQFRPLRLESRMPLSPFCPCFSPTVSDDSESEDERENSRSWSLSRELRQRWAHVGEASNQPAPETSNELEMPIHYTVEYSNFFVKDMDKVLNSPYYWGVMDRYKAEELLNDKPEGTFLLRDSAQKAYLFSVSFRRYQRTLHARIEQDNHRFGFDIHDQAVFSSDSVTKLIANYKDPARCLFFEPLLTHPLQRNFTFTLQEMCRAKIATMTTYDKISQLKIPTSMKHFLRDFHYIHPVRTIVHE